MSFKFKIPLSIQIILGVVLGLIAGVLIPGYSGFGSFVGDLFLRLLKMLIIPLIFSSIVMGVVSTSSASSFGRLGLKTLSWYLTTSLLAILTGQFMVNLFRPGVGANLPLDASPQGIESTFSLADVVMKIVPDNIIRSMADGQVLPVIFFALLTGYFLGRLPEKTGGPLIRVTDGLYHLMMNVTGFVIMLAPVGIFGLIYRTVAETGLSVFSNLALYFLTVLAGLLIHFFVTLPLLLFLLTRKNPYVFMRQMLTPLITAFSTSSSSATLPLTIRTIEEEAGVSNRVAGFVLPLGATVNMDGTALYECAAVIFIAQVYGIDLSLYQQVVVVVTALLVSIGAAGIPMAGLVMMTIILRAVNLPLEGVGLIIAVDRFLDMFRTATNVLSDSTGTYVINHTESASGALFQAGDSEEG